MSEEKVLWEQMEGEPNLWFDRFTLYRLLGPKRTLSATHRKESEKSRKKSQYLPGSWRDAALQWNWKERAEAWDAQRREDMECEAYEVFSSGLALAHERVRSLKKCAERIEKIITREKKPSSYLLEQWRGLLSDIADELGERVKTTKTELTGKDGGPLQTVLCLPDNGDDDIESGVEGAD